MRVLIADDEPRQGDLLAEVLRAWGYEPLIVHDGLAALATLRAEDAPRLALVDWLMPGLDGIEVCRAVRKVPFPYCYLVLVTGRGGHEQRIDGLHAGADDFLAKPVDTAELKARLATARCIIDAQLRLHEQATRDSLTGQWNRAAILALLERELGRSRREGSPLAVALADLDHFKQINDTFGHLAGDRVLCQAARRMRSALRAYDALGRYGGEEFLAVLPGCCPAEAMTLAERLRKAVAEGPVELEGGRLGVTLSLGVAAAAPGAVGAGLLLRRADQALYRAKAAGRNCAWLSSDSGWPLPDPHDLSAAGTFAATGREG
jgi:two-component system cell cycle response regulator